jgi:WD40 repeat protein
MCSLTFQTKNGSGAVLACEFAPKGDTIVSGSSDKTLKIWDVASGTCQATLEGHRYLFWFVHLSWATPLK